MVMKLVRLIRKLKMLVRKLRNLVKKRSLLKQQVVVAEEIGGSDNDADKTENHVVAMVEKESDCDSDEDSDGFDDEGFNDMYDSEEFDNEMAEEEVVKKLDQFQSEFMNLSNEFYKQK